MAEHARVDLLPFDRKARRSSPSPSPSPPANLIWLGASIGIAFYLIDALMDALVFDEGTLAEQLLSPSPVEIWVRLVVFVLCTLFGIYAHHLLKREHAMARRAQMAEQFLVSVIDNIPDMIFIKDAEALRFVRVNPAAERLLGYSAAELTGRHDHDLFPETQADAFVRMDRKVLAGRSPAEVEEEIDTKGLGRRILHTKKVAVYDQHGAPAYLLGIAEDITRRKQAEIQVAMEKERAERYLQIARAMIVALDRAGRVELLNRRGCEILGYTEEEILGRNWFETVIPEPNRAQLYEVFARIMAGDVDPVSHVENEIVTKDGSIRYIAWNNSCVRDPTGRIIGTLSSGQDITDRMLAEQELHRHQRELAHVMRLTTMGEMASGMAHELNQPLAAIVNYCQAAMHMLSRGRPATDIGIVLTRAMEQAHRAGDIIRHLREFVGKGATTRGPIPINDIIRNVVGLIEWDSRNAQVSLELRLAAAEPRILADKVQIEQVVFNLLRNGLEAIQDAAIENGHIVVESTLSGAQTVRVQVRDNGPGVSPAVLERLFEPFRTTKAQGMGIGLSISQSIIEAHGGRLWFDRSRAEGACFGFDLPQYREGVPA